MSKTVFILGAGASKEAGAPLMYDFLDVADELRRNEDIKDAAHDFEAVFRGRAALQAAHSKSQLDIHNLESVFSAFEMAGLIGKLGNLQPKDVGLLTEAMARLIAKTLDETTVFPVRNKQPTAPVPFGQFLEFLRKLATHPSKWDSISVITFNYDLCMEYSAHFINLPVNYCLSNETRNRGLRLLKLHGSLNWVSCDRCKTIAPWQLEDYLRDTSVSPFWEDTKRVRLGLLQKLSSFGHCPNAAVHGPVIVPPTWSKGQYHSQIAEVWRAAAEELAAAENIYVFGYSLPPTDQFFRYLYALGTIGDTPLKRFWIFDPNPDVATRFRELLGPGAQQRFDSKPLPFGEAIGYLRERMRL